MDRNRNKYGLVTSSFQNSDNLFIVILFLFTDIG